MLTPVALLITGSTIRRRCEGIMESDIFLLDANSTSSTSSELSRATSLPTFAVPLVKVKEIVPLYDKSEW
jgi:hypothetical protein